jgi:AraC family transcriptional regulator, positive regulator of tynA and feaB
LETADVTEKLFAFDERNYQECQTAFRGTNNQEYYLGEYTIDAGSTIDVRADKKAVGAYSIIRLRSKSRLFFRRSWAHIREDATDLTVLWFVKRGSLGISHQGGNTIAKAGDFAVTKSIVPFTMECRTDEQSQFDVLHVVVPTHIFRRFVPGEINAGFCVPAGGREFHIAEHILMDVFDDADELTKQIEQLLVDSALSVLGDGIKSFESSKQERQSLSEKRLQDAMRFVEIHLSDPKLNAAMVADACGISQRYLSHLLRQQPGTSFSALVWNWRLKTAYEWLSNSRPHDISIAEIAFRIGFKSPAHFSRLFKRAYNMSPREYRTTRLVAGTAPEQEIYLDGPTSLQ